MNAIPILKRSISSPNKLEYAFGMILSQKLWVKYPRFEGVGRKPACAASEAFKLKF